jgi:hypothetical protein
MKKTELIEVKKGKDGYGLLIENDGYAFLKDSKETKQIKESIENGEWTVPYPFVVDAVFQKFGVKNANGRIYPEDVLKKQVEVYQERINERRAYGECYKPDAMVLSADGWKPLSEIKEGDIVLTLNPETNQIEKQPVSKKIEYDFVGDMIHIHNRNIDDVVTPNHGYPIYDRNHKFAGFKTAEEIMDDNDLRHYYIPKQGDWVEKGDEFFILKGVTNPSQKILQNHPDCVNDVKIPMETFMKFLGIYLSEGDYRKTNNDVNIYQKKESVCELIEEMLIEMGFKYTINTRNGNCKIFRICDPRLNAYVSKLGNCYTKYIPNDIKNQSKENLRILYDWFVLGDGRIRGDKHRKNVLSDDVFSASKQLILDLNEIQLKIGYSGNYHLEPRDNNRIINGRIIEGKNCSPLHFSLRSLTKGIYLDKRFINVEKEAYNGKVMCIEVPNHIWYVMCNNKCHWTKNCNHPAESTIDLGRVSHNIIELHWEGRTLVGKMELNISEGFRKYGICSSLGDTVALLLLNGYKIGVSSRGVGSVEQKLGQYIVGDDFELICWDVVSDPSTPNAYISTTGGDEMIPWLENDSTKTKKSPVNEKIEKINKILTF